MRLGARSIRGALGAYLAASVVALAALALVLWIGWPRAADRGGGISVVELASDSSWAEAALDDGQRQFSLEPGQRVAVPPGHYRLLLLSPDGRTESRELQVGEGSTLLR